jgi:hypothetical protein
MTAALIGLIGVVAGALLAGLANYEVERRKRLDAARAAGLLIADELQVAVRRLKSATADEWWAGELPTEAWKTNLKDLVHVLPDSVREDLRDAYNIIEA